MRWLVIPHNHKVQFPKFKVVKIRLCEWDLGRIRVGPATHHPEHLNPLLVESEWHLEKLKTNKATIPGDIPARVLKENASSLCIPLTKIINASLRTGDWPDSYKQELITAVGKVFPVELIKQLRPISNLPRALYF